MTSIHSWSLILSKRMFLPPATHLIINPFIPDLQFMGCKGGPHWLQPACPAASIQQPLSQQISGPYGDCKLLHKVSHHLLAQQSGEHPKANAALILSTVPAFNSFLLLVVVCVLFFFNYSKIITWHGIGWKVEEVQPIYSSINLPPGVPHGGQQGRICPTAPETCQIYMHQNMLNCAKINFCPESFIQCL